MRIIVYRRLKGFSVIQMLFFSCLLSAFWFPQAAEAADPIAGAACTVAGATVHSGGPELSGAGNFLVCSGGVWLTVISHTATGRSDLQINNDTGSCTSAKTGRLRYSSTTNLWDYCSGSAWVPFEQAGSSDCNLFGQVPGYVCPDGTVFAGYTATKYLPMFTTPCDAGQTWSGSACTGTATTMPWNNGNTTGYVTTSLTNASTGAGNTTSLSTGGTYQDSNSAVGGVQPHQAAQYCDNLVINGRSDWYLPAQNELYTMWLHSQEIGNFTNVNFYWTSNEWLSNEAWYISMDWNASFSGGMGSALKQANLYVRCVRKN